MASARLFFHYRHLPSVGFRSGRIDFSLPVGCMRIWGECRTATVGGS